ECWFEEENYAAEEGRGYLIDIDLKCKDGYVFDDDAKATINGKEAELVVHKDKKTAYVYTTFRTVGGDLLIITQPKSVELHEDESCSFTVSAAGGSGNYDYKWVLSYDAHMYDLTDPQQYQKAQFEYVKFGGKFTGMDTATLTYSNATYDPWGYGVYCVVTDKTTGKTVESDRAELDIVPRSVSSYEELKNAIDDAEEGSTCHIRLDGDIYHQVEKYQSSTLYSERIIVSEKTIYLDLNGHTFQFMGPEKSALAVYCGDLIIDDSKGGGKVIADGMVDKDTPMHAIVASGGGVGCRFETNLTVNGGTFISAQGYAVMAYQGTVKLNGGTYQGYKMTVKVGAPGPEIQFNGGTFLKPTATGSGGETMQLDCEKPFTFNGGTVYGTIDILTTGTDKKDSWYVKGHLGTGVKVYINGAPATNDAIQKTTLTGDPIEFK
ncbi:MAG: hypothetical protein HUJ80_06490, partial [Firmicutes bacterium]|nr:hypothetical protein [Bacillota bacterium]